MKFQIEKNLKPKAREILDGSRTFGREIAGCQPSLVLPSLEAAAPRHTPTGRGQHPGQQLVVMVRSGA